MWFALMAFIAAGFAKGVNTAERIFNRDLDGDGDIGIDNPVTPTEPAAFVAQAPVEEVIDPECDASTYRI